MLLLLFVHTAEACGQMCGKVRDYIRGQKYTDGTSVTQWIISYQFKVDSIFETLQGEMYIGFIQNIKLLLLLLLYNKQRNYYFCFFSPLSSCNCCCRFKHADCCLRLVFLFVNGPSTRCATVANAVSKCVYVFSKLRFKLHNTIWLVSGSIC
jgi:hypothetical protein